MPKKFANSSRCRKMDVAEWKLKLEQNSKQFYVTFSPILSTSRLFIAHSWIALFLVKFYFLLFRLKMWKFGKLISIAPLRIFAHIACHAEDRRKKKDLKFICEVNEMLSQRKKKRKREAIKHDKNFLCVLILDIYQKRGIFLQAIEW